MTNYAKFQKIQINCQSPTSTLTPAHVPAPAPAPARSQTTANHPGEFLRAFIMHYKFELYECASVRVYSLIIWVCEWVCVCGWVAR